ncbi:hypothetical protein N9P58_01905 [Puniceicoccaceae bacterium]|nr:hypothetical protein [Puniceicoccaceae bacterium]
MNLQLKCLPAAEFSTKKHPACMQSTEAFPCLTFPFFKRMIINYYAIIEGDEEKGLVFHNKLMSPFRSLADADWSLLIYNKYQREGLGTEVIKMICGNKPDPLFMVPDRNHKSLAFFCQSSLSELQPFISRSTKWHIFKHTKNHE